MYCNILTMLKCTVFIISFVMFCYQLNTATLNLMNPGLVDINHERNINDDDLPLITVCPTNQANLTRVKELGYKKYEHILMGEALCYGTTSCTSWGKHMDLTFDELKNQVFNLDKVKGLDIRDREDLKPGAVFLPGYGFCKEILLINFTRVIVLFHNKTDDVRVVLTEKKYKSYFMPDVTSHVGSKIFMKPDTKHLINVNIQERNNCKNNIIPMSGKNFKECVEDKIQNEFEKNNISCLPPWLSENNQCDQIYPEVENFYGNFWHDFYLNYRSRVGIFRNIRIEDDCRQSCKETTYIVEEEGASVGSGSSYAIITFNQKVVVTEKVPNYDMFKFIIDVGSSLGLWLGLSVLGLHDLVVWAVKFVMNSFIIKKIRSAATK